MPHNRFFDPDLRSSKQGILKDQEAHHALHVMRIKPGDHFEVIDGKGSLALAKARSVSKRELFYDIEKIDTTDRSDSASDAPIIHLQAQLSKAKLELIVEKSTELGSSVIVIFKACEADRSPLNRSLRQSLEKKMQAALKQSGRLWLPELLFIEELSSMEKLLQSQCHLKEQSLKKAKRLYFDLSQASPLAWKKYLLSDSLVKRPSILALGPESGWREKQREYFQKQGYEPTMIHSNCLRAETAAIAALSIVAGMQYIKMRESSACEGRP